VAARDLSQDASLCTDPTFSRNYERAAAGIRTERNRVLAILGLGEACLAIAFLVLLIGAGLSPWWWFAILVNPLGLFVQGWGLWRLAAYPVRYWEQPA
jgi:hypothetical protein